MESFFTNSKSKIVDSDRVLYTASTFARNSLFHLQEIGRLEALKPHVSSRSNLQSYLFFIVENGSGTLKYNGREYGLSKGSCVFIDCRKPYSHQPDPDDLWTLSWCHFYGPTLSSIYNKYCERGGRPVFAPSDTETFLNVIRELIGIAKSGEHMRDMLINEKLSLLLRLIMAESWHPEDKALPVKKASVLEVKAYLDENYESKITLDGLCARFFIPGAKADIIETASRASLNLF